MTRNPWRLARSTSFHSHAAIESVVCLQAALWRKVRGEGGKTCPTCRRCGLVPAFFDEARSHNMSIVHVGCMLGNIRVVQFISCRPGTR